MNTRNPKLLFSILSFIFCLNDRLADCCLIDYSNGDEEARAILVKLFELFNKIPTQGSTTSGPSQESRGETTVFNRQMEKFLQPDIERMKEGAENNETIIFKEHLDRVLQPDIERIEERVKMENKLNVYDFAVLIVKGLAFQNSISFIKGNIHYKRFAEHEVKANDCAYVAMYLASFVLHRHDPHNTDTLFQRLLDSVTEKSLECTEQSDKFIEGLEKVVDKGHQDRLVALQYVFSNLVVDKGKISIRNPKMENLQIDDDIKFCRYFGEVLYGNKARTFDTVELSTKWGMASELAEKIKNGSETNMLTNILRMLEIPAQTENEEMHGLVREFSLRVVVIKFLVCLFSLRITKQVNGELLLPYGETEQPHVEYLPIDHEIE